LMRLGTDEPLAWICMAMLVVFQIYGWRLTLALKTLMERHAFFWFSPGDRMYVDGLVPVRPKRPIRAPHA